MKTINPVFLTLVLFFAVACGSSVESQTLDSPQDFKAFLDANDVQLIDVRTADEVNNGYIAGAVNFDFHGSDFENRLLTLNKDKPVMVYCAAGGRSGKAAQTLKGMGFREVHDLDGGINAWKNAGLPLKN